MNFKYLDADNVNKVLKHRKYFSIVDLTGTHPDKITILKEDGSYSGNKSIDQQQYNTTFHHINENDYLVLKNPWNMYIIIKVDYLHNLFNQRKFYHNFKLQFQNK